MPISPAQSIIFAKIIIHGDVFLTPHNEWAIVEKVDNDMIYYRIINDENYQIWILSPAIIKPI